MKNTNLLDWAVRVLVFACLVFTFSQQSLQATEAEPDAEQRTLLVLVFDQNCKAWCAQVRPVVADLQKIYGDRVEFSEIDVTPVAMAQSKKKAKELRILKWLEDVQDLVPLVMIFPSNRHFCKELVGPKTKEIYENQLKEILSKRG
jgi:hypothetical protein